MKQLEALTATLALVGFLTLGGCIIPRFDPDCPDTGDIDKCLEESGCGFCDYDDIDGICIPGTALGPDNRQACAPMAWHFNDSLSLATTDIPCWSSTCTTCTYDEGCGWCEHTGECWPLDYEPPCMLITDSDGCW